MSVQEFAQTVVNSNGQVTSLNQPFIGESPQVVNQHVPVLINEQLNPALTQTQRTAQQVLLSGQPQDFISRVSSTYTELGRPMGFSDVKDLGDFNDFLASHVSSVVQNFQIQNASTIENGFLRGFAQLWNGTVSASDALIRLSSQSDEVAVALARAATGNPEALAAVMGPLQEVAKFMAEHWDEIAVTVAQHAPGVAAEFLKDTVLSLATCNISEFVKACQGASQGNPLDSLMMVVEGADMVLTGVAVVGAVSAIVAAGTVGAPLTLAAGAFLIGKALLKAGVKEGIQHVGKEALERVGKETMEHVGTEVTEKVARELGEEALERVGKSGADALEEATTTLIKEVRDAGIDIDAETLRDLTDEQLERMMDHLAAQAGRDPETLTKLASELNVSVEELNSIIANPQSNQGLWNDLRRKEFERIYQEDLQASAASAMRDQLNREIEAKFGEGVTFDSIIGQDVESRLVAVIQAEPDQIPRLTRELQEAGWQVNESQVRDWRNTLLNSSDPEFESLREEMIKSLSDRMLRPDSAESPNALRREVLDSFNRQWNETIDNSRLDSHREFMKENGHRAGERAYDNVVRESVEKGVNDHWDAVRRARDDARRRRYDSDGGAVTDEDYKIRTAPIAPIRAVTYQPVEVDDPLRFGNAEVLNWKTPEEERFWREQKALNDRQREEARQMAAAGLVPGGAAQQRSVDEQNAQVLRNRAERADAAYSPSLTHGHSRHHQLNNALPSETTVLAPTLQAA